MVQIALFSFVWFLDHDAGDYQHELEEIAGEMPLNKL
jgi:hypothetical protein